MQGDTKPSAAAASWREAVNDKLHYDRKSSRLIICLPTVITIRTLFTSTQPIVRQEIVRSIC